MLMIRLTISLIGGIKTLKADHPDAKLGWFFMQVARMVTQASIGRDPIPSFLKRKTYRSGCGPDRQEDTTWIKPVNYGGANRA